MILPEKVFRELQKNNKIKGLFNLRTRLVIG